MSEATFMSEATLSIEQPDLVLTLFGAKDQHLRTIRDRLGVEIVHRRGQIAIRGEDQPVALATETLERLTSLARRRGELRQEDVEKILAQVTGAPPAPSGTRIDVFDPVRKIQPRTPGQARYVETIRRHAITIAYGPAGTGKTYLAVALAVEAIKHERIRKIVLCRPAVEAGESLGFLPGDMQ
ncbi:MAG TPA: PhoH family protein, partial [Planctomycetaceae bacterium]|nr:PhoH family protein [Planctomycetaceae bacterium]